MTPTPPSADDPIDPAVRSLLWRLRARLVTPPDEARTIADLDRLFAAAREHAHGPGAPAEVVRIVPPAAEAELAGAVGQDPVARIASIDRATRAVGRRSLGALVGRAAAAAILVVAVGGGLVSVREGEVNLEALLGRSPALNGDVAPPPVAAPSQLTQDAAPDDADTGAETHIDETPEAGDGLSARRDGRDGASESSGVDAPDVDTPEATTDDVDEASGTSNGETPAPAPASSPSTGGSTPQRQSSPDATKAPVEPPSTDHVIAAPPAVDADAPKPPVEADIEGAGEPVDCPKGVADLPAACRDDADGDDADADEDVPVGQTEVDADADKASRDGLARRRGGA